MIIDVSYHQGYIDWQAAADSLEGAWIKATGEETAGPVPFKDPRFLGNWRMAKAAGVKRGAYHFLDGAHNSADGYTEAEFFIRTIENTDGWGELRPAIDVEWPPKGPIDGEQVAIVADEVWGACGKPPLIYTGRWAWDRLTEFVEWLGECPLWLASYTEACPAPPKPWSAVALWQHTDKGRMPGISTNVDLNRLMGPMEGLTL